MTRHSRLRGGGFESLSWLNTIAQLNQDVVVAAAACWVSLLFISSLIMSSLLSWDLEGAYMRRYQAICDWERLKMKQCRLRPDLHSIPHCCSAVQSRSDIKLSKLLRGGRVRGRVVVIDNVSHFSSISVNNPIMPEKEWSMSQDDSVSNDHLSKGI